MLVIMDVCIMEGEGAVKIRLGLPSQGPSAVALALPSPMSYDPSSSKLPRGLSIIDAMAFPSKGSGANGYR
jgi:hypothetical protein